MQPANLSTSIAFYMTFETPDWLQRWGSLLLGYGVIGGMIAGANQLFGPIGATFNLIFLVVLAVLWTVTWFYLQALPPKNRTNKFGICLLIETEDARMRSRLENDLVRHLNEIVRAHKLQGLFEVVVGSNAQAKRHNPFLSDYQSKMHFFKEKVPTESVPPAVFKPFGRFQKKTNCHFFVWGSLIERQDADLKGDASYALQTDAIIVHSAFQPEQQKLLNEQFLHWVKEFRIHNKAEFQGLRFTAKEVFMMANLVIGTAATMAGNVAAGLLLHEVVLRLLDSAPDNKHSQSVRKHLIRVIKDEHQILASVYITVNPERARLHITKTLEYDPRNYGAHIQLARLQYDNDGDANAALATTLKSKSFSAGVPIWRYNVAFLQMASGHCAESWKTYREIFATTFEGEKQTVREVIDFNLKQFQDKGFVPSLLIVGILAYKKIGNLPFALEHLEMFIKEADGKPEFSFLFSRAQVVRSEILDDMSIS